MADPRPATSQPTAASGADARASAARLLHAVRDRGRSLTHALDELSTAADTPDRPLVHELAYGALRTLPRQEALIRELLHKPLKRADRDLEALIMVGLYQLIDTRIPPHAAVAATVEAARSLGKAWAVSLVNASLRRFVRERRQLLLRTASAPQVRWLFPIWMIERLKGAWPQHWQAVIDASNARAPMFLRINPIRIGRPAYARLLAASGLAGRPVPETKSAIVLDHPVPTVRLPGYVQGQVSVQDLGAQRAAQLLDARPGERILDACAAPGGKSAHILERAAGDLDLTAVDIDEARLQQVRENLDRLGLKARVVQGDATSAAGDWAQTRYQRILLDAPCSGTGVIRRHPDIKWLRRDSDIAQLSRLQGRLLDALWRLLAPGGTLLYVTCSLLPEENEEQIRAFLGRQADADCRPIGVPWGISRELGRQALPQEGGPDGFYYAILHKARL